MLSVHNMISLTLTSLLLLTSSCHPEARKLFASHDSKATPNTLLEKVDLEEHPVSAHKALGVASMPSFQGSKVTLNSDELEPGYLQVTNKDNLFYLLVRAKISNAPLVIYFAGGPGASSIAPAFLENGPWNLNNPFHHEKNYKLTKNTWSWNKIANLVYLDQPRYVGFSYGEGAYSASTQAAGHDFLAWLRLFYQRYPEFIRRPLYLSGESFAGVYIGEYAHQVLQYNRQHPQNPINLSGLLVQSGKIGDESDVSPYYQLFFLCTQGMLSTNACQLKQRDNLRSILDGCVDNIANSKHIPPNEVKISDLTSARNLSKLCRQYLEEVELHYKATYITIPNLPIFPEKIRGQTVPKPIGTVEFSKTSQVRRFLGYSPNPYNVRLTCKPNVDYPPWCYDNYKINHFFNDKFVNFWLGRDIIPSHVTWQFANFLVAASLETSPIIGLSDYYIEALRNGIKAIFIYGKNDWVMNYFVTQVISNRIAYQAYGIPLFSQLPASPSELKSLTVIDGHERRYAGEYQTVLNFTFAQIDGAGHMVGMDRPAAVYKLFDEFLLGNSK